MTQLAKVDQRVSAFFNVDLHELEYAIAPHAQLLGGPEYERACEFGTALRAEANRRGYEVQSFQSRGGLGYHFKFLRPKNTLGKTSDLTIG